MSTRCEVCQEEKENDLFEPHRRGVYGRICRPCFTPMMRGEAKCKRCGEYKPYDQFGRSPKNARRAACNACFMPRVSSRLCAKCKVVKPFSEFDRRKKDKRPRRCCRACHKDVVLRDRCHSCKKPIQNKRARRMDGKPDETYCITCYKSLQTRAVCSHCKVEKSKADFPLTVWGAMRRRCKSCPQRKPHRHKNKHKAPEPCLQCGKEFYTFKINESWAARKYCSQECKRQSMRQPRACDECLYIFEPHLLKKMGNNYRCRRCSTAMALKKREGVMVRSLLHSVVSGLRSRGKVKGSVAQLREKDVLLTLRAPCGLCGEPSTSVCFKNIKDPLTAQNLLGTCGVCKKMLAKLPFDELRQWALSVAQGMAPAPITQQGRKKKAFGRPPTPWAGTPRQQGGTL